MDFYTEDALSMLGGDNFTQINNDIATLNATVVFKAQTQTITGDKTFTSKIVGTGNIDVTGSGSNSLVATGLSANNTISVFGTTAYNTMMVNGSSAFNQMQANGADSYNILNTNGLNSLNEIRVNNTPKITTTDVLTTLENTAHTINGVTTFDVPPISAVAPTTANQLVNKTYADGKVSKTVADTISAIKTFSVLPESSVAPTTANQLVNKTYVDDTIVAGSFVTLTGTQTITGDKTLSGTTTFTGNITANALTITPTELGYLDGATSNLQTQITAKALDSAVVHNTGTETVAGTKFFTSDFYPAYSSANNALRLGNIASYSFLDFRSGGTMSIGGYDVRLASAGGSSSTSARGALTIEAGSNTITANAGSNTMKASTGFVNDFQVAGSSKLTVGASIIAINPTTEVGISINGTTKIDVTSSATTITNSVIYAVGILRGTNYQVGISPNPTYYMSGVIEANQTNVSLTVAGIAMSIGGFAKTNASIQQGIMPFNIVIWGCVFCSDNANQTNARTISLEVSGTNRFFVNCPSGIAYQSIVATGYTGEFALTAGSGYYIQIKTNATSATMKSWNCYLYYYQY